MKFNLLNSFCEMFIWGKIISLFITYFELPHRPITEVLMNGLRCNDVATTTNAGIIIIFIE